MSYYFIHHIGKDEKGYRGKKSVYSHMAAKSLHWQSLKKSKFTVSIKNM